jgi:hypothetical protein
MACCVADLSLENSDCYIAHWWEICGWGDCVKSYESHNMKPQKKIGTDEIRTREVSHHGLAKDLNVTP